MKKYLIIDILDIIFIPLITYLLGGLLLIWLCAVPVNATYFVVWGIMAGIVLGIQKWFSNKAVTMGIVAYGTGMVIWFGFFVKSGGMEHALLIVSGFAIILILRLLMRWHIVKVLMGFSGMGILIYGSIMNEEFSKGLVFLAIILFLNAVSEIIAFFYSGNAKSLIVIYVMVAAVTLFMPVSKEPYGWDFVVKIINAANALAERIATEIHYQLLDSGVDGIFRFGMTGYSDEAMNLSEGLFNHDMEQLILEGHYTRRNLYLKGNVNNKYTGNSWETDFDGETLDYRIDTLMTLYAIFRETDDITELRHFMEIKEQKIILQNIKTQSLFYPIKLLDISVEDMKIDGDNLLAPKINGRGYSYSYTFVDIDYSSEQIIKILKNSSDIEYEEAMYNRIYEILKETYKLELEKIPFDTFREMAQKSRENAKTQYQQMDSSVSNDVKMLAEETAKNCTTEYEVCKTLEKYLYQYNYNKAVLVPENVNVLDWFLFEGKEGYCAHYATALAVMLRSQGIPVRVAEGFLVDYKNALDIYTYSISGSTAHVWVEAYIEGFGWIRLEPTVVNAQNANAVWFTPPVEEEETKLEEEEEVTEEEITEEEALELAEKAEKERQKMSWILMLKLLGGMILIIAVILIGLVIWRRISIRKSNNPEVVFGHLLSVLGKKYTAKKDSETLGEYFERLCAESEISEEIKKELPLIKESMEGYWYGNSSMKDEDIARMKSVSRME